MPRLLVFALAVVVFAVCVGVYGVQGAATAAPGRPVFRQHMGHEGMKAPSTPVHDVARGTAGQVSHAFHHVDALGRHTHFVYTATLADDGVLLLDDSIEVESVLCDDDSMLVRFGGTHSDGNPVTAATMLAEVHNAHSAGKLRPSPSMLFISLCVCLSRRTRAGLQAATLLAA